MEPKKGKKIGIMGGTFNPIHYGHLMIAENAAAQYELDKVLFIPNKNPPHKANGELLDAVCRCRLVALAIADNETFELSLIEVESDEVSYTYRTLTKLKENAPENQYYFIMGADSLLEFDTWKNPHIICKQAVILAAVRDGMDETALHERINILRKKYGAEIYGLSSPNLLVSSHDIRKRVREGRTIRYLLPEQVREYIEKEKLYRS